MGRLPSGAALLGRGGGSVGRRGLDRRLRRGVAMDLTPGVMHQALTNQADAQQRVDDLRAAEALPEEVREAMQAALTATARAVRPFVDVQTGALSHVGQASCSNRGTTSHSIALPPGRLTTPLPLHLPNIEVPRNQLLEGFIDQRPLSKMI